MAKSLTPKIQRDLTDKTVKMKFVFTVAGQDLSDYLISFSTEYNKEFGAASATFTLNNEEGKFGDDGSNELHVGDTVSLSEYFGGDSTEFKKFYGEIRQRSITKSSDNRSIVLVCLDYIGILQDLDIDLECEGEKIEITDETLTPNYLASPNDSLAQLFNFANDSIATNPKPSIIIKNKNDATEDPQFDGFDIYYDVGQLKLGFPLNAKYNYDLIASSYYFYTHGLYIEDIIEDILTEVDGYGNYLFGEPDAQSVITNHLTEDYFNIEGTNTNYLTPNYTSSTITIETKLAEGISAGATSVTLDDASGFPDSDINGIQCSVNGDIFTYTTKVGNTLSGIPSTGTYALKAHTKGSYIEYENSYSAGQVWYLKYSNLVTTLTTSDFIIPGGVFKYLDKRYGRIILTSAISTSALVKCNTNYYFKTLQATGIELNQISFRSREVENRLEAIKKLRSYLAPNYILRTLGDNKIWASYLSQATTEDYELELATGINYLEDEDLYTRVVFYRKNKNPTNLMFNNGVDFVTTGESYKGISTSSELAALREEGNYYVYGMALSSVGKITANVIKPIVYINEVPINNTSQLISGQQVVIEVTTRTETTTEGGGK